MSTCAVNQCKYALLLNAEGGIVCDPIILRLEKNKFWISTSDCDLELWIKGVNVNSGLNVNIHDANVSLLQIQGPKSSALLTKMFGEQIYQLKYYWLKKLKFKDIGPLIRFSTTGRLNAPSIDDLCFVLGKKRVIERISRFLEVYNKS